MQISKEQVEHIAKLARLSLDEEAKTKLASEFSSILSYIDQLNEVDVSKIFPMTGATQLRNSWRDDIITQESGGAIRLAFLSLAPLHTEAYIETISPLTGK